MTFKPPSVQRRFELDDAAVEATLLPDKLDDLVHQSLDKAEEILGIPFDEDHPLMPQILRAQTALINTTLTTQTRVDETNLKRERNSTDVLAKIIAAVERADEDPRLR